MASPSSTAVFLLFLLSAAFVLPSHAQLPITIQGVQAAGLVSCSLTGNPSLTSRGLAGVNVIITCNGGTTSIGSVLTDTSGFFSTILRLTDGLLFTNSSMPCFVTVQLPVGNCTLLPPNGTLRAPLNFAGSFLNSALGLVAQTVPGLFSLI